MKTAATSALILSSILAILATSCTTATPTPNPTPSASATATPAPTPAPSVEPTPEPTVEPTATPAPTAKVIYGLTNTNRLVRFSSMTPGAVTANVAIQGLPVGSEILGIDFRPIDKKLYGVGSNSRVYTIDTTTGQATAVGPVFNPALVGASQGFDFNPMADRIRTHGSTRQNLRLHPVTGAVAATDTQLAYTDGDANAGAVPQITGTAYTNSIPNAPSTELYAIDSSRDTLVKLADPNSGKLSTIGGLGVNTSAEVGFDISSDSAAFAALRVGGANVSGLYSLNLANGTATLIENIGFNGLIIGIAIE